VLAIAGRGSDVFVGGTFTNVGGINVSNIARWDGANWWNMGVGFDASVGVLAASANAVYAGGSFTNVNDPPFIWTVNHIAMWDGANWSGLGSGATGTSTAEIRALAFGGDGKLYCCGRFTNISGISASSIARWDGTKWEALGSGFSADSAVVRGTELAIRGDDVFIVGTFSGAGLTESSGIARWNDTMDFTPPFTMNFSRTQLLPGNLFKSRLNSSERVTYLIEYSDDFQTWTPLMTNSATQLDFTNAVSPSVSRRVFRAGGIP